MSVYDDMVAQRAEIAGTATPNVEQEVMQRIALAGLSRLSRGCWSCPILS